MTNRIKYIDLGAEVLRSEYTYNHPTNGARFYILIKIADKKFEIWDEVAEMMVTEGKASSYHKVLIKAKKTLQKLGIGGFEKEGRAKRLSQ